MIDIFTKCVTATPIKSKQIPDVLAGIMEGIVKTGHKPITLYIYIYI